MQNLNEHSYLPDFVGATDSTLDLLADRTRCSCCTTHLPRFRGSRSPNVRSLCTSRMVYASRAIGRYHKLLLLWHRACPSILLRDPTLWPAYQFPPWYACCIFGLESVFTPTLARDHLLDESRSSADCE